MEDNNKFTFEISLNILNHLGRNLYRSFVTVLGEAISNAWDADAENVHLYIYCGSYCYFYSLGVNREENSFIIRDDGVGMSVDDFQNKFLKIGYSKRKDGKVISDKGRPYIGRKGIGKLALLSCAAKICIISKTADEEYIGGIINNSDLDDAIIHDLAPDKYELGGVDLKVFNKYLDNHNRGTLIYFENINEGINNRPEYLKKLIALYFRFSLIDNSFNIFLDDEEITIENLTELAQKTEYLWKINDYNDPYIQDQLTQLKENRTINLEDNFNGFIASVEKPRDLKVLSADERVSIDLFTNGRLREKDILKYMPSARIVENYLYGQIHYNELDDEKDRFSSSREGIVADDPKFIKLLESIKENVLDEIINDWDKWRVNHKKSGDPENERIALRDRRSLELYHSVSGEYVPPEDSTNKDKVDNWIGELEDDATYNFGSYAECFISENLARKFIQEKRILPSTEQQEIDRWRRIERREKRIGNLNIEIRQSNDDLFYLSMEHLVKIAEPLRDGYPDTLLTDEKQFTPIRNAVMHTSLLTPEAKRRLTAVYDNIKGRIKNLLSSN